LSQIDQLKNRVLATINEIQLMRKESHREEIKFAETIEFELTAVRAKAMNLIQSLAKCKKK